MKVVFHGITIFFVMFSFTFIIANELENDGTILVVGDKINVRKEPDTGSEIVYQLRISKRVKILKTSMKKYNSNGIDGQWVYIDTQYTKPDASESIKGWVVDFYLADYSKFKKVKNFLDCKVKGTIGDWVMDYQFQENGKYKRFDENDSSDNKICKSGSIYQYRKVLILKDDDGSSIDYFYFDENNHLCHYYRDKEGKSFCFDCEMKK
ncbi:MAG: SH3 domain-containing protein [Spirochaetota bacterium]